MSIYIGIDGGGTKTAIRMEKAGVSCDTKLDMPSNPNDVGFEKSARGVAEATAAFCRANGVEPEQVDSVFAGVAGASTGNYRAMATEELKKAFPNAVCSSDHDGINLIYAAFPDCDGAVVICGTGSSCFVKANGIHRIGGYSVFDLGGNGYEIGKAAIAHALRSVDGRDRRGTLCARVEAQIGSDALTALRPLLAMGKGEIASFARAVIDCYDTDEAAKKILEQQLAYVSEIINTAGHHFTEKYPVCLAGGVTKSDVVFNFLQRNCPRAELFRLEAEPVEGALNKAKSQLA